MTIMSMRGLRVMSGRPQVVPEVAVDLDAPVPVGHLGEPGVVVVGEVAPGELRFDVDRCEVVPDAAHLTDHGPLSDGGDLPSRGPADRPHRSIISWKRTPMNSPSRNDACAHDWAMVSDSTHRATWVIVMRRSGVTSTRLPVGSTSSAASGVRSVR